MEYDIKRGHLINIEGDKLENMMAERFGNCKKVDDTFITSYGAMKELRVKIIDKSTISIETESDTGVSSELAMETIRRFNLFLEQVTGFTSKQRRDRLNKKAKEGKL